MAEKFTAEQKSWIIQWLADGKRPFEIRALAAEKGFDVTQQNIEYYRRTAHDAIRKCVNEDYRTLPLVTGLAERAKRVELRTELVQRMMDEIIPQSRKDAEGLDLSRFPLIKQVEELLRGIQLDLKDLEPAKKQSVELIVKGNDFDPKALTDEQLQAVLDSLGTRMELESSYEEDVIEVEDDG